MSYFIIYLDSGKTSAMDFLSNSSDEVEAVEQKNVIQIYPESGWLVYDLMDNLEALTSFLDSIQVSKSISISAFFGGYYKE